MDIGITISACIPIRFSMGKEDSVAKGIIRVTRTRDNVREWLAETYYDENTRTFYGSPEFLGISIKEGKESA